LGSNYRIDKKESFTYTSHPLQFQISQIDISINANPQLAFVVYHHLPNILKINFTPLLVVLKLKKTYKFKKVKEEIQTGGYIK
jgi:hypothetical protein